MSRFDLTGKFILVTGASSGIGRGISVSLAQEGATLILFGRNKKKLEETLMLLPGSEHVVFVADLTDNQALIEVSNRVPSLDGLVHSAGIIKRSPLKFMSKESFQNLLDINVVSGSELLRYLNKEGKIKRGASIVLISSVGSDYASLGNIMYMSTKGAVNSMIKGLAFELARKQIRVNGIQPGLVITNLTKQINSKELEIQLRNYPLGRFGNPEDIGAACVYLLSNASDWMTGSLIKLDGGLTLK